MAIPVSYFCEKELRYCIKLSTNFWCFYIIANSGSACNLEQAFLFLRLCYLPNSPLTLYWAYLCVLSGLGAVFLGTSLDQFSVC